MSELIVVKLSISDLDFGAREEIKDANKSVFRDSVRYTIKVYSGYITMEEMHGQVRRNYGWRKCIGY